MPRIRKGFGEPDIENYRRVKASLVPREFGSRRFGIGTCGRIREELVASLFFSRTRKLLEWRLSEVSGRSRGARGGLGRLSLWPCVFVFPCVRHERT